TLVTPNLGALGALTASVTTDDSHTTGTGGVITWQYTVADNAVAYLAEGQTKQETFTISLFDGTSTVKQDVTVTITGTEDKPTITAAAASDSVTEDSLPTTASGTIDFADVDLTDSHTVSATPGGSGYLGAFTPIVSTDSTGDGTGQVTWSFAVNNAELQFLADGQKLTQIYTVTVNDGHTGGTVDQLVTVTITGTNDNPTVSATATTPFTEAADAHAQHLSESGTVNFADIDANDLVSVTSASNNDIAWSGGTLDPTLAAQLVAGFSTGVSNADAPGSTPWNYDVTSANLDFLAAGEKITFSYTVTATDNHGGNGTTTVNFTINGTNDAAVVHADTNWATEDDPNAAGNVLQTIAHTGAPSGTFSDVADTDVDDQATLSVSNIQNANDNVAVPSGTTSANGAVIHGLYGTLKIGADGSYSYQPNDNINNPTGVEDDFTYTVTDGLAPVQSTLKITVFDGPGPTETGTAALTVNEAALDLSKDEADLGAGLVTGSNSSLTTETAQDNALTFTSGSDNIIGVAFSLSILPSVSGAAAGTSFFWMVNGSGQLEGHIGTSASDPLGIILSISGATTANAGGNTASPTITATLTDNFPHAPGSGSISVTGIQVVATDTDGDTATGSASVAIIDDVPTAVADTDSIAAGGFAPATGNVILGGTDAGDANTTDGNADTQGADGAVVSGVAVGNTGVNLDSAATVGNGIHGSYGTLKVNADGSYTYVRDAGSSGGVNDVFTYTIKDGDGDLSHTTLTISIGDSTPSDVIPAAGGATTTVFEKGLPPRGSEPAGSGEIADGLPNNNSDTSETTSGTISFSSPDGISLVSLGGHTLSTSSQTFADGTTGSLTASYIYDPATKLGTISYSYTLLDNTLTDPSSKSFAVVVTDADGDSAPAGNLTISIIDDVPTAVADTDSIAAGGFAPATGNVILGGTDAGD
ncbi:MAG: VCBS domain-containing protein, partial [Pseudolabrys sp.]